MGTTTKKPAKAYTVQDLIPAPEKRFKRARGCVAGPEER
jgi:hypothetical protein